MDTDSEVSKKPVDERVTSQSVDLSADSNYDNLNSADTRKLARLSNRQVTMNKAGKKKSINQAHGKELSDQDDISSLDDNAASIIEDINFAKSFGIELRGIKCDRLMNSNHVLDPNKQRNQPEPLLETSVTTDCIYHKGTFYQKGDIVAICDQDDGQVYFAQLMGFLQDRHCEKSASLNWLVPTRSTSRDFFDPSAYKIGLEDSQLRKLDCMTFVRHCPHDYYLRKFFQIESSGVERVQLKRNHSKRNGQNYIWTTMNPCAVPSIRKVV